MPVDSASNLIVNRDVTFASFIAIVPMCCVTATAIAAMIAEAFREPGERMPIGPLGAIGLVGAAVASAALWNSNATSFGVVVADNFGLFVTWILIVVGLLSLAFSGPDHRARAAAAGRVLRADAVRHRRR